MAADVAEAFSGGEIRLTVDEKILFPNVDTARLPEMMEMPFLKRFPVVSLLFFFFLLFSFCFVCFLLLLVFALLVFLFSLFLFLLRSESGVFFVCLFSFFLLALFLHTFILSNKKLLSLIHI